MNTDERRVTVLHDDESSSSTSDVIAGVAAAGMDVATLAVKDNLEAMVSGLRSKRPDLVVNLVQRFGGSPRHNADVAAALDLLEVTYTGASSAGLYLASDPDLSRRLLAAHDVPSAGSGGSVNLVVPVIGNERPTVMIEDAEHRETLATLAAGAWAALRLRDYALLHVRLARRPALLAAVPNPPLGRGELFARACFEAGLRYEAMIAWILDEAWERRLVSHAAAKTA